MDLCDANKSVSFLGDLASATINKVSKNLVTSERASIHNQPKHLQ